MILITGSTGFIGSRLVEKLEANSLDYRLLIFPGSDDKTLPQGKTYDVVLSSLEDRGSLRTAFNKVDTVFHLAGIEQEGSQADLSRFEVRYLETFTNIAKEAGVQRFYYLSHLGADRNSAYGLLKANGRAEAILQNSGLHYTIIRSSWLFGEGDHFTESIAGLIKKGLGFYFLPGDGGVLLQPLWVEDLVTALVWSLDMSETVDQIIEVGGPEHLSYREVVSLVGQEINKKVKFLNITPVQYSYFTQMVENRMKKPLINVYWMDYLSENRTCALDSMSRIFEINPARMKHKISYLKG
ncbi:MAG TPA: NAD(P)H-binding protein [Chloroflexi bacterium]|jgi:NADH dehydrogenase|nr:NAD(P)H-binding protein [Anaerolineaceae bacterium]HHX09450.1 NAD(P)H-binding protein [Chloroflexota bacterium]